MQRGVAVQGIRLPHDQKAAGDLVCELFTRQFRQVACAKNAPCLVLDPFMLNVDVELRKRLGKAKRGLKHLSQWRCRKNLKPASSI